MHKFVMISLFVFVAISAPPSGLVVLNPHYASAIAADGGMSKVQLILKKLRASMASMKDLDELEKAGMSKRDVDRMRRALNQKIIQMTNDAVDLIRTL